MLGMDQVLCIIRDKGLGGALHNLGADWHVEVGVVQELSVEGVGSIFQSGAGGDGEVNIIKDLVSAQGLSRAWLMLSYTVCLGVWLRSAG